MFQFCTGLHKIYRLYKKTKHDYPGYPNPDLQNNMGTNYFIPFIRYYAFGHKMLKGKSL